MEQRSLGGVDASLSLRDAQRLKHWHREEDANSELFCELDDDRSPDVPYTDLLRNLERFTGYSGDSAHRIWRAIYEENCFTLDGALQPAAGAGMGAGRGQSLPWQPAAVASRSPLPPTVSLEPRQLADMCIEKRVFYRLVSGMHASISIHLSGDYLDRSTGQWGPNATEFCRRFSPATTGGHGPLWLRNLYFAYVVVLRAVIKARPVWDSYDFYPGDAAGTARLRDLVLRLVDAAVSLCPSTFDEHTMFAGGAREARTQLREFRAHFRNISRIMDCVDCDKCRLWGKLQVLGLGTALRILFADRELGAASSPRTPQDAAFLRRRVNLRRTEVAALFHVLHRFSRSIIMTDAFCTGAASHEAPSATAQNAAPSNLRADPSDNA